MLVRCREWYWIVGFAVGDRDICGHQVVDRFGEGEKHIELAVRMNVESPGVGNFHLRVCTVHEVGRSMLRRMGKSRIR